tara:strand:+ start:20096 stop:20779 length:684 start_codon:yes stop_codon:yes gene_type:complete
MKILIATPAYDGKLDVWYVNSLHNTVMLAAMNEVQVVPIFMSNDALVQRARNDLIRIAVEEDFDSMIFIDSDMEWNPQWILDLVNREEDVVGGTTRKKTDDVEMYVVKTENLDMEPNGLIEVTSLGTGFVKLSREAVKSLWESSEPYMNEGRECRMVCDVQVVDGELHSEDTVMFNKLRDAGHKIWLDPTMTCNHMGGKKFLGNFENYRERVIEAMDEAALQEAEAS